jgi:hypothetical protein
VVSLGLREADALGVQDFNGVAVENGNDEAGEVDGFLTFLKAAYEHWLFSNSLLSHAPMLVSRAMFAGAECDSALWAHTKPQENRETPHGHA